MKITDTSNLEWVDTSNEPWAPTRGYWRKKDAPHAGPKWTIGMAAYDDFDGVYFTIQSLRAYHSEALSDTEIVVIDTHPGGPHSEAMRAFAANSGPGFRIEECDEWPSTAVRSLLFEKYARGEYTLCLDSHVLLMPGALAALKDHFAQHPSAMNLVQGPLMYDNLDVGATHMDPIWQSQMFGVWGRDRRGCYADQQYFEIPMHGLGAFACRTNAWPGIHRGWRGFGGEEGYVHNLFRARGDTTFCLPAFRWLHRFQRPNGIKYRLVVEDKCHNYYLGHLELGINTAPVTEHFRQYLPLEKLKVLLQQAAESWQRHRRTIDTSATCLQLGEPTGAHHLCDSCNGKVRVKEFNCPVHGSCTTHKEFSGVKCCIGCQEKKLPIITARGTDHVRTAN